MKKLLCLFLIIPSILVADKNYGSYNFFQPLQYLLKPDAEKILGQAVKLSDSSFEKKDDLLRYKCTYTALSNDIKTNRTVNLYYLVEQYSNIALAQKAFATIISGNSNMQGQKQLTNLGDEAFIHTDAENFCLIMVRQKDKILRMKINKLTALASLEELKKVTKKIILKLS